MNNILQILQLNQHLFFNFILEVLPGGGFAAIITSLIKIQI